MTAIAPIKAAMRMATNPEILTEPAEILPPRKSITNATPSPAPLLTPNILGPASGLRNAVCSISPLTANAPPQSIAVMACGRRDSRTINRQDAFSPSSPKRILTTSAIGIRIDPITRLSAKSIIISTPNPIQYPVPLRISRTKVQKTFGYAFESGKKIKFTHGIGIFFVSLLPNL